MLFAIPYHGASVHNHFSKAPQIMLWDSKEQTKRVLDLPPSSACCERKKYWQSVVQENNIDAVIVRSIGANMLNTLFKMHVTVLAAPRQFDLERFDTNVLKPITDINFARPSAKKHNATCSGDCPTHSISANRQARASKLSPKAMSHLAKVFKCTTYAE